jgi:hypothetical protein
MGARHSGAYLLVAFMDVRWSLNKPRKNQQIPCWTRQWKSIPPPRPSDMRQLPYHERQICPAIARASARIAGGIEFGDAS